MLSSCEYSIAEIRESLDRAGVPGFSACRIPDVPVMQYSFRVLSLSLLARLLSSFAVVGNPQLTVSIKRLFRKEPLVSTVVTAGTVNILLGMWEGQALLAFLGVLVVSGTISLRGWQHYLRPVDLPERSPMRYLPDQPSRPPMPTLELDSQQDSSPHQ